MTPTHSSFSIIPKETIKKESLTYPVDRKEFFDNFLGIVRSLQDKYGNINGTSWEIFKSLYHKISEFI